MDTLLTKQKQLVWDQTFQGGLLAYSSEGGFPI